MKQWIKENKRSVIVTLVLAFLWSWLFLVDVGNLAKSLLLGFVLMFVAYVVMVTISSLVVLKTWSYISAFLKKPSWKSLFMLVLVWAVVEFLLAWLLGLVWMGREGSWDNMVPFVSLTPMIVLTPLRFLTRLFGFFGTSALVGTGIIIVIASIKRAGWRKFSLIYWGVIIIVNLLLWRGFTTANGPAIKTTLASEHLGNPQIIDSDNSDLIIVPEYGLDNYSSENITSRFSDNSREVFFSGTKQYGETDGNNNTLIYGSNRQGFLYEHKKSRLIVGGEYLPLTYEMFVRTFAPDLYTDFQVRRAITKGTEQSTPFTLPNGVVVGNAACSSIIHPDDYRRLTAQGATVLANSASLEVFRGSRVFALHHDGLAKYMAVANARPFLQSANDWKAFAIDHNGNTLTKVQPVGYTEVTIQTNSRRTPYSYLGEWVVYSGLVFIAVITIVGVMPIRRDRRSKKLKSRAGK